MLNNIILISFKRVSVLLYKAGPRMYCLQNRTLLTFSVCFILEHISSTALASCDAYKSATIAMSVIAGIAIVCIVLLVLYIVRRIMLNHGMYSCDTLKRSTYIEVQQHELVALVELAAPSAII